MNRYRYLLLLAEVTRHYGYNTNDRNKVPEGSSSYGVVFYERSMAFENLRKNDPRLSTFHVLSLLLVRVGEAFARTLPLDIVSLEC